MSKQFGRDLVQWGCSRLCMPVRSERWDSWRVGASAQPIETEYGWLEIYHGVRQTSHGPIYRLGAAILDIRRALERLLSLMDEFNAATVAQMPSKSTRSWSPWAGRPTWRPSAWRLST